MSFPSDWKITFHAVTKNAAAMHDFFQVQLVLIAQSQQHTYNNKYEKQRSIPCSNIEHVAKSLTRLVKVILIKLYNIWRHHKTKSHT